MLGKDRRRNWGRTEKDAGEGQKKMLKMNRRRCYCWGRREEDAEKGQKKMLGKDRE
jgi:hypothetical protein